MDDLDLIKTRLNIIDIISEYLPLKKAGINFKANCPFHLERSPSFMVSPERQIWHCFGCQKGGDVISFLMEKEGIEFKEALDILAKKAGVSLNRKNIEKKDQKERLYDLNEKAAQFFNYILISHKLGESALEYLKKRGLEDKTIKNFNLGYAPLSWESLSGFLKKRGYKKEEIIQAGLGIESKRGCYDRFRGRVMFPLLDARGRIIGFAGRVLTTGEPKYINTPQTLIFDKSKFLFGIHLSKTAIREKKEAILVEGEMDMILSFQSGIENIVATKGTALTEGQLEILKRHTDTLALCFDADLAGDFAARRGIEMADRIGMNLKVIQVEGGKDPAELCLMDPYLWGECVKKSVPVYDYYLESAQSRFNPKNAVGKRRIFEELLPVWAKITDPMTRDHYVQKLGALLQVKDELIKKELYRSSQNKLVSADLILTEQKDDKISGKDRRKLLEEYLLVLILHIPEESTFIPSFPETLFNLEDLRSLYVLLVLYLDRISFQGKSFKISDFIKEVPKELVFEVDRLYLFSIDDKLSSPISWLKEINSVVTELKRILIKASLGKLSMQIKTAQEFDKIETLEALNRRFRDLSIKLKNL